MNEIEKLKQFLSTIKTPQEMWVFQKKCAVLLKDSSEDIGISTRINAMKLMDEKPPIPYKFNPGFAKELVRKTKFNPHLFNNMPDKFFAIFDILNHWIFLNIEKRPIKNSEGNYGSFLLEAVVYDIKAHFDRWYTIPFGGELPFPTNTLLMEGIQNHCLLEPFQETISEDQGTFDSAMILNGLAYIRSGEPDLRQYKPPTKKNNNLNLSRRERDRMINECGKGEAVLVSWGWKKPSMFSDKEYYSAGHFWWCPYGPRKLLRKWDWREGSLKKHKNNEDTYGNNRDGTCEGSSEE